MFAPCSVRLVGQESCGDEGDGSSAATSENPVSFIELAALS